MAGDLLVLLRAPLGSIAFVNVSLQIVLSCPAKDRHPAGQEIRIERYPHFYPLQPFLADVDIIRGTAI
jgi:hypothetical protein